MYCQACGRQVPKGRACKCKSNRASSEPPHYARVYCRTCAAQSRWRQLHVENGKHPSVISWECVGCGAIRYQYADCTNVETMCVTIMEENLRRTGANLDHDEAVSRLVLECYRLYIAWDEGKGLTFESYAFGILRRRANDIYRQMLGRNGEKPLANALSLNAMRTHDGELLGIFPESEEMSFGDASLSMVAGRSE